MTDDSKTYAPFSQRTGIAPIPPQLKLGEVSAELRRLLYYYLLLELDRVKKYGVDSYYLDGKWKRVAQDIHVKFLLQPIGNFRNSLYQLEQLYQTIVTKYKYGQLFDFIEFLVRHNGCSDYLKQDFTQAFVEARAAYRIFDNTHIAAIGTEEQAASFERAIRDAEVRNATSVRKQLIDAGVSLRNGKWADCLRDSIHAVEGVAKLLAPNASTLGAALRVIEQNGHLHGSLKSAFDKLYGYASDEEGVRHALVFEKEANVDEVDALFMLGACASFVSYLLARTSAITEIEQHDEQPPDDSQEAAQS